MLADDRSNVIRDAEISIQNEDGGFIGIQLTQKKVML